MRLWAGQEGSARDSHLEDADAIAQQDIHLKALLGNWPHVI